MPLSVFLAPLTHSAVICRLQSLLHKAEFNLQVFMSFVGVNLEWFYFFQQQGTNANILERYSSFTRKENKTLFKIKASKKVVTPLYILLKMNFSSHVFSSYKMLEESQNSNYSSKYLNDLKSTPLRSEGIPRISKMFKTILSFKQTIYTVRRL